MTRPKQMPSPAGWHRDRRRLSGPRLHWVGRPLLDTEARGAIVGLTRDSGARDCPRRLGSVVYQTALFEAMAADGTTPASVRVDGSMAANDWTMQFLADVLSVASSAD